MEKIIQLIDEFGLSTTVDIDTRIYQDLNIYGDDAWEFLRKYSETFSMRIDNFNFSEYFPNEGDLFISIIWKFISKPKYKELTIGDLLVGIEKGILNLA